MAIALYGINTCTTKCEELFADHEVIYATTLGGESHQGQTCLNINELASLYAQGKVELIVICSMYVSEITTSLLALNVEIDSIYYYDLSKFELKKVIAKKEGIVASDKVLYAFYDLACNLPTFDCVQFAILAELTRLKRHLARIHFVIVADRSSKSDAIGISQYHDGNNAQWRVSHIVEQVFSLIESCAGVSCLSFREQASFYLQHANTEQVFPTDFNASKKDHAIRQNMLLAPVQDGRSLSVLQANPEAYKLVDKFLSQVAGSKRVISITLREYEDQSQRNSSLEEWAKFLDKLDKEKYLPVIIRDTYQSSLLLTDQLAKYPTLPLASIDVHIRVALYDRAFLNMAKTNGAFYLCNFIPDCRSITFIEVDETNPTMSSETWLKSGYEPGSDAFLRDNRYQKIVWDNDTYENIQAAFDQLIADCH